jgi:hypothetical protein
MLRVLTKKNLTKKPDVYIAGRSIRAVVRGTTGLKKQTRAF